MKRKRLDGLPTAELATLFETAASVLGRADEEGDYRTGNKQHKNIEKLWKELQRRGEDGRAVILRLLESTDIGVRYSAAFRALSFAPEKGERVLEEVASGPRGINRLNAETLLDEWRKGKLRFND